MKNLITNLFCLLICFQAISQEKYPKTLIIEKDTIIAFNLEQSRELTRLNEERKFCLSEKEILDSIIIEKDTIISQLENKVTDLNGIEERYMTIIREKDDLSQIYEEEKNSLRKEIKRQKRHKWFAVCGGVAVAIIGIIF